MTAQDLRRPGDWAVCPIGGVGGSLVNLGEQWCGKARSPWQHAKAYLGDGLVLQAEPHGATITEEATQPGDLWSTGILEVPDEVRGMAFQAGQLLRGTPYSWLDYAAIGLHYHHISPPGLRSYIASTGHLICFQLVDEWCQRFGVHLFTDGRWPGYVLGPDMAGLLGWAPG